MSLCQRDGERVAGLIYLDAAYSYAYYDRENGDVRIDALELQRKLQRLLQLPADTKQLVQELLEITLPQFQKDLQGAQKDLELMATAAGIPPPTAVSIQNGSQKYTDIPMPALAIYAVPKDLPAAAVGGDEARRAALEASLPRQPALNGNLISSNAPTVPICLQTKEGANGPTGPLIHARVPYISRASCALQTLTVHCNSSCKG